MSPKARRGVLLIDGWEGRSAQPVIIEDETPQRYRVRAVNEQLRLPSRGNGVRIILRGGTVLVPKHAVRLDTAHQHSVNCPKVAHIGGEYLHSENDDSPYDVDGVSYCGRCHQWLPLTSWPRLTSAGEDR